MTRVNSSHDPLAHSDSQRLALLPLLMVIYSFVIFAIIQAPPGDFLTAYVATLASSGSSISAEQIAAPCATSTGSISP